MKYNKNENTIYLNLNILTIIYKNLFNKFC